MSNKKITGYVPSDAEARMRYNGYVLFLPHYNKPIYESISATLVISPGKVFTEEEVKAMLKEMMNADAFDRSEFAVSSYTIETIAAKHGLTL